MKIIEQYLQEVENNPYRWRQIDLDPKITSSDWSKFISRIQSSLKFFDKEFVQNTKKQLLNPEASVFGHPFIIVDKGKRVGLVAYYKLKKDSIIPITTIFYTTWSSGHNYAVRGVMKLLTIPETRKYKLVRIRIHDKNIASLKVVQKLKYTSYDSNPEELNYQYYFLTQNRKGKWWWT